MLDLLFASSGIEAEVVADAEPIEVLPALTLGVARTGHLIALKLRSRDDAERPQDVIDLRAWVQAASVDEIERARMAAGLIKTGGYHRGRDLTSALEHLIGTGH